LGLFAGAGVSAAAFCLSLQQPEALPSFEQDLAVLDFFLSLSPPFTMTSADEEENEATVDAATFPVIPASASIINNFFMMSCIV
jgi:hypothetical protein